MAIRIFTDSSCDLPPQWIKEKGIHIVPLKISFGNETFLDRVNLSVEQFYNKMRNYHELPKTAAPSPHDYQELFEKVMEPGDDAIVISLSSALSSTYHSAKLAVQMFQEEHSDHRMEVFDSKNGSIGLGLIVFQLAKMSEEGKSFQEIIEKAPVLIKNTFTIVLLETIENAVKGGRVDRVKGMIASMLNIKVLLHVSQEGTVEILDKARGSKNALKRFLDLVEEFGGNFEEKVLAVAHSNCEEKASQVKQMLEEKYKTAKVFMTEIGPTIGTYASEGGLLISF
ncbi:DegV family protein [Tepidibacillus marianensis]|uniref:DegV family protein n=1 Tax=Tepidibacillus marianensis TaxID=3131995 RepID=UPI0030D20EA3